MYQKKYKILQDARTNKSPTKLATRDRHIWTHAISYKITLYCYTEVTAY